MLENVQALPHEEAYEQLIQGLLNQEFGVSQGIIDESIIIGLRANLLLHLEQGEMHPAGVGRKFDYKKNAEVRGDLIKWIEPDTSDLYEQMLLERIQGFINHLNSTCYTSINDFEFHYAFYEQGSFYKRHLDQFKNDRGRLFSLVIYLNDDWQKGDGGNLSIYRDEHEGVDIYPKGGKAVFFKSDEIEHEVHPSLTRNRLSVAGWLKKV